MDQAEWMKHVTKMFYANTMGPNYIFNAPGSQPPITMEGIKAAMDKLPPKPPENALDWLSGSGAIQFGNSWPSTWKPAKVCDTLPTWFGFNFSNGEPDSTVVKIPGGWAIVRKLDEHLADLRRRRDAEFEGGLRELKAASDARALH